MSDDSSSALIPPLLPGPIPRPWGFWPTWGLFAVVFAGYSVAQTLGLGIAVGLRTLTGHELPQTPEALGLLMFDGMVLSMATLASLPAAIGLTAMFASLRRPLSVRDYLGLRWPTARESAVWTGMLALFLVALTGAAEMATRFFGRPEISEFMRTVFLSARDNPLLWLAVLVAAPVGEEVMFRGFLFAGLAQSRIGPVWAAIMSSAMWAGIHLQYDLFDMAGIFFLGLLLSAAWWKTRSVYLCIGLHALVGLVASVEMVWTLSQDGLDR